MKFIPAARDSNRYSVPCCLIFQDYFVHFADTILHIITNERSGCSNVSSAVVIALCRITAVCRTGEDRENRHTNTRQRENVKDVFEILVL